MVRSAHKCEICGTRVRPNKRGRPRERHRQCARMHEAICQLEKAMESDYLREVGFTDQALIELRYRLFCLVADVPRPRDSLGRFVRRPKT